MKVLIKIILLQLLLVVVVPSEAQKSFGWRYSYKNAKAAYEGTWKYEDDTTIFVLRIKCLRKIVKKNVYKKTCRLYGTYSLILRGVEIVRADSLLLCLKNFEDYPESLMKIDKDLEKKIEHQIPMFGVVTGRINTFWFKEISNALPKRLHDGFRVEVDRLNKKNKYLYWDIWKEEITTPLPLRSKCRVFYDPSRSPKPGDFQIPEKCTLTRISHDPYYEIDMDL